MEKVDVVILAGGAGFDLPDSVSPPKCRAMIPIQGKTMLQWEVDAMRASQAVGRICAVGDVEAVGLDEVVRGTDTFLGNILAGAKRAAENGARTVLLATSDIPLITPEGIRDFVERASVMGADFCYPIISKTACLEQFPDIHRTYLKLREGAFSGGNMMLVSVDFVLNNSGVISQAHEARKQVFRLAGMIGWGTLLRVLLAQFVSPSFMDIPRLEATVGRMLHGTVKAVVTPYAEIGEDVDKPEDLAAVEKYLARPRNPAALRQAQDGRLALDSTDQD